MKEDNCLLNEYKCELSDINRSERHCISMMKLCDGEIDCKFGDDEKNCDLFAKFKRSLNIQIGNSFECPQNLYPCYDNNKNLSRCLNIITICNMYKNENYCDNILQGINESLRNFCDLYLNSRNLIPFDCGNGFYISNDLVS